METRGSARIKAAQTAKALALTQASHIIWTPEDIELHQKAIEWAKFKNKEYPNSHVVIENGTNCFKDINPNVVLYLHCHGIDSNELSGDSEQNIINGQLIEFQPDPERVLYTPNEMAKYLIANGLNPLHQHLELAACYSNQFAKDLFECLTQDGNYPNLSVYGYHRMYFIPDQDYPYGLANVQDNIIDEGLLAEETYEKVDIRRFHDARLARNCYGQNQALNKEIRESLRKTLNDNLPNTIKPVDLKIDKFDESIIPDGSNSTLFSPDNFPIRTSTNLHANSLLEQRKEATYAEVVQRGHLNLFKKTPAPDKLVNDSLKAKPINSGPAKSGQSIKPG